VAIELMSYTLMNSGALARIALMAINLVLLPYFTLILLTALAALARRRTLPSVNTAPSTRFIIAIPAHDEASGIGETVASCLAQEYSSSLFEIMVIADNCTDETAALAARAGATVLERTDLMRRGKGYAITYLIDYLNDTGRIQTCDALVVIDADTTAQSTLLSRFDQHLAQGHDWIQCYDTISNCDQSWRTRLMTYAFSLINGVALLGQNALGLSAAFRGNGMCFSTKGLHRIPFRMFGLAEDLEYSWAVRLAGEWIAFAPDVAVYAAMPAHGADALAAQRSRWEYGRSEVRRCTLLSLLKSPRLGWVQKTAAVIELTMPTMVVLSFCYFVLFVVNSLYIRATLSHSEYILGAFLIVFNVVATIALGLYAISPYVLLSLPWRFALSLVYFPFYALWKQFVLLQGRPKVWKRTMRK
jgi:cellulose synthase/poly-beta-1,6-N-acetylglucosamine synthase-like glycosyltransferase